MQTNHQLTKVCSGKKKNLTRWFAYEWGELTRQKPHRVILRSPLPRIYYYQNKWLQVKESKYLIPTYSWTLTPIPNWTCFVVTIFAFQCTAPNTWLNNKVDPSTQLDHQLKKDVGYKVLQFIIRWRSQSCLVKNPMVYKTQQLFQELGPIRFLVTLFFTLVELYSCATMRNLLRPLK